MCVCVRVRIRVCPLPSGTNEQMKRFSKKEKSRFHRRKNHKRIIQGILIRSWQRWKKERILLNFFVGNFVCQKWWTNKQVSKKIYLLKNDHRIDQRQTKIWFKTKELNEKSFWNIKIIGIAEKAIVDAILEGPESRTKLEFFGLMNDVGLGMIAEIALSLWFFVKCPYGFRRKVYVTLS